MGAGASVDGQNNPNLPVSVEEFDFFEPLGKGGYGRVVAVRRRSTGKEYAMKIMPKSRFIGDLPKVTMGKLADKDRRRAEKAAGALAAEVSSSGDSSIREALLENIERLLRERNCCLACEHPFINKIAFATQTLSHLVLVMDLVDGAKFTDIMLAMPADRWMTEDMVQFYVAEVAIALNHMHERNIMYRDLKMSNIMVHRDGHLCLIDLGLCRSINDEDDDALESGPFMGTQFEVGSFEGPTRTASRTISGETKTASLGLEKWLAKRNSSATRTASDDTNRTTSGGEKAPIGSPRDRTVSALKAVEEVPKKKRTLKPREHRMSCVGTTGFIAPEVLQLSVEGDDCSFQDYGREIDYWALGALAYKMLMGRRPFPGASAAENRSDEVNGRGKLSEYRAVTTDPVLEMLDSFSSELRDLLVRLLDFNPKTRLGSVDAGGFEEFKKHPFFAGLDWDALERKEIEPPFIPEPRSPRGEPHFSSYSECVSALVDTFGDCDRASFLPDEEEAQAAAAGEGVSSSSAEEKEATAEYLSLWNYNSDVPPSQPQQAQEGL